MTNSTTSQGFSFHLPKYDRSWLRADLIAGVTSWALVVPQAVAYAQIGGLEPSAGLSAAFAGPLGYAFIGSSRQLMVTPTSSTAAISASLVDPMAGGDPARYLALSAALAILAGAIFLILGWLQLGFVSQFLAISVQVGFMFGLGMVITVGQLPKLLGIEGGEGNFFPSLWHILTNLSEINYWTLGLGGLALGTLIYCKRYLPSFPAPLVVVGVGILITWLLGLQNHGVDIVGTIPRGLPFPSIPKVGLTDLIALFPPALLLAILGYAETASVAQDLATRHHYEIKPNRELAGVGVANALSGFFQGFMVAGGASQTASNDRAGAKSQLSSLVVSGLTLITAFALTPVFYYLPQAVLGAIVINAVMGFFRTSELQRFYHIRRDSFWLSIFTLAATLLLGVLPGLILSVAVSILLILVFFSRASASQLGLSPEGDVYADLAFHADYQAVPGMLIMRINAPIMIINARRMRDLVVEAVDSANVPPKVVVIDMGMNPDLDIETADVLGEVREELERKGVSFWLANLNEKVREILMRSGYSTAQTSRQLFATIAVAVETFQHLKADAQSNEGATLEENVRIDASGEVSGERPEELRTAGQADSE